MAGAPYLPMYVGDYFSDTMHLSTLEHGAYTLLIYTYWKRGGALPDDDEQLARIVRMSVRDWRKVKPVIAAFFTVTDRAWTHKRIDRELANYAGRSAKASDSANARWKNERSNANAMRTHRPSNANASPEQCSSDAIQVISSRNTQNLGSESPAPQRAGLSPERGTDKNPRAKPDRPRVVYPKLGEGYE
jgi:uncharacterized protein YdaU (DUF1376 family)